MEKMYTEVVELTPWEFIDKSMLPSALIFRCYSLAEKHVNYFYWPLLNRIYDGTKNVNFEAARCFMQIYDKEHIFPKNRRLLFKSKMSTIFNKRVLKIDIDIFYAESPNTLIANYSMELREVLNIEHESWLAEFTSGGEIKSEIKDLVAEDKDPKVINLIKIINKLKKISDWQGPVETDHVAISEYCEFNYMFSFVNYAGPMISIGREAMIDWLKKNNISYPNKFDKKFNYLNWKLWIDLTRALFLKDKITMKTYFMQHENKLFFKHEIYLNKPHILVNTILEEYTV